MNTMEFFVGFLDNLKNDFLSHSEYLLNIIVEIDGMCFFPGGNNGPYMHIETPVRNTSHILVIFSKSYKLTGDVKYKVALNKVIMYLLDTNYYINRQYIHRRGGTDTCNGVIGDAWVIEGISSCLPYLTDDLKELATKRLHEIVDRINFDSKGFFAYRYDSERGLIGGDFTYNHQLWLMASLAQAGLKTDVVSHFLDVSLSGSFLTRKDGLINHLFYGNSLKNWLNIIRYKVSEVRSRNKVNYKERGYHLFNIFAFCVLYKNVKHDFFNSEIFLNSLSKINSEFLEKLYDENNIYSIQYNSPAFELPFIYMIFSSHFDSIGFDCSEVESIYRRNKNIFWSKDNAAFTLNKVDKLTYAARVYEISYAF